MNTNTATFRIGISIALLWAAISGVLVWQNYSHAWPDDAKIILDRDACDDEIRSRIIGTNQMMQPEIQHCIRAKAEAEARKDELFVIDYRQNLRKQTAWQILRWCILPVVSILLLASLGSNYFGWIKNGRRR